MNNVGVFEIIQSVLIIAIFLLAGKIVTFIIQKYVKKWAEKTKNKVDDLIVDRAKPPLTYIVWFLGVKIAVNPLGIKSDVFDNFINTVITIVVMYLVIVVVDIFVIGVFEKIALRTKSTIDDALMPLVRKTLNVGLIIMGIIWVLKIWSIDISPILASIGIAGLAIGLAVKDSLANIFGGVSLILDKTIKVGDKIKLEDGQIGNVVDVGLRSTKIRTFDNELVILPNGKLANSKIQNYSQPDFSARVVVDFGVSYDVDVDMVKKIVLDELKTIKDLSEDHTIDVLFLSMEDFYLKFSARFWVPDYADAWDKKLEAVDKIFKALKKHNITIPYPTQEIIVKK